MVKRYAIDQHKMTDIDIEQGEPVVRETWIFTYPDGQFDYLQRRHPVTDPNERAAIMNYPVECLTVYPQLPGDAAPANIEVTLR